MYVSLFTMITENSENIGRGRSNLYVYWSATKTVSELL